MADTQNDWIVKRLEAAGKAHPITDEIISEIEVQLRGVMCERPLLPKDRTALAEILLKAANNLPNE